MTDLPPGHRVREARDEDAEALLDLYHAAYSVHGDPHRPPTAALKDTLDDVKRDVREARVLVVEDADGRIVGTVALKRVANVRRLAVAPDAKRQGLGKALMDAVEDAARAEGFGTVMLDTYPEHPWLTDFYRDRGYRDRSMDHFANGETWRQLRKRLAE